MFSSEGGIERMMRLYLKALCENAGPQESLDLIALNDPDIPVERRAAYADSHLRSATGMGGNRWRFTLRAIWCSFHCDRVIAGHFHLLPVLNLIRRFRPKLDLFIVAHGTEIWRPWSEKEQGQARRGIKFLAVSRYTRNRIAQRCPGLREAQLHIVPNTIDPSLPRAISPAVARERGLILSVARLCAEDNYKGIDHLIQAMPTILKECPFARLRIVGRGNDRTRLEDLARAHAPGKVEFAGFVPDADMPKEYSQAHLFALPSRDEGFGLVYLEAFSFGTPCIAVSAGAAEELLTPETGRCTAYGDVSDLAAKVIDALGNFSTFCHNLRVPLET